MGTYKVVPPPILVFKKLKACKYKEVKIKKCLEIWLI